MNLFWGCADILDSKRLGKQMAEALQVYTAGATRLGLPIPYTKRGNHYKPTHMAHPCCVWAGESVTNALMCLSIVLEEMGPEWAFRGFSEHACVGQAQDVADRIYLELGSEPYKHMPDAYVCVRTGLPTAYLPLSQATQAMREYVKGKLALDS